MALESRVFKTRLWLTCSAPARWNNAVTMNLASLFGGLADHTLELPTGDRVSVSSHGGQVLHWRVDDGEELLYLSPAASASDGQAIRGGIPVCWPQFNMRGPLPKHGFARHATWRLHGRDNTSLLLELTPADLTEAVRAAWPHEFQLRQKIDLAPGQLTVTLDVSNLGQAPFSFTTALHSYLRVADVAQAQLSGLERTLMSDGQAATRSPFQPPRFGAAVDRVHHVPPPAADDTFHELQWTLTTPARTLTLRQSDTLPDVVVWNPGPDAGIADLAGDEWRQFVCVEAAAVDVPVTLAPGAEWIGWQAITLQR